MSIVVFVDISGLDVGDGDIVGRKMPFCPTEDTWNVAVSRFVSIRRLPAPWGVGFEWWEREDGGILQPMAMPVLLEK